MTALILCLVLLLGAPVADGFLGPRPGAQPAPRVAPTGRPLTIAQLQYGGGGDWYANPSSLPNLLREIRERTGLPVADRPAHVKLTDAALWTYPYIYITGHGNIRLTDEEVVLLRRYLLAGGFLHADDNYGLDESFRREMRRVFPDKELVELPADHPVYRSFYEMRQGLPKIHEHDGKPAQGFGIFHEGRLLVYYSYQSDLGDGWEDADVHGDPPELREAAFRMGVNLFLYALSQVVS
ncbi:MAG TPA: DUF4159 domain-containing protein [Longimicrobiales bacterium]